MVRQNNFPFYLIAIVFFFMSCGEEEKTFEERYPVGEGQSIKYNNEYLKVIDDEDEQKKPQRLINQDAMLNLGELTLSWGDFNKTIKSFRKGGTDLHFSKTGLRMRIRDMYDFQLTVQFFNEKDPFKLSGLSFTPGEGVNKKAHLEILDVYEKDSIHLIFKDGSINVTKLNATTGEMILDISGKALNLQDATTQTLNCKLNIRFEQVTSSVRPA